MGDPNAQARVNLASAIDDLNSILDNTAVEGHAAAEEIEEAKSHLKAAQMDLRRGAEEDG